MNEFPVWLQVLFGFGGFTLVNVISTSVLWGRMQEAIKKHSERLSDIEEKMDPKDPELRFVTCKECYSKQLILVSGITEIKMMLGDMDKRHEARINRIDTRWEGNLKLIYSLQGRIGTIESDNEKDEI